jgi:hypothetical protein
MIYNNTEVCTVATDDPWQDVKSCNNGVEINMQYSCFMIPGLFNDTAPHADIHKL